MPASELAVHEAVLYPLALLLASALTLTVFNNTLRFIATAATTTFAKGGAVQRAVQPYIAAAKPYLDNLLGGAISSGPTTLKLEHLLLCALLIACIGLWRSVHISNQYAARQLKATQGVTAARSAPAEEDSEGRDATQRRRNK